MIVNWNWLENDWNGNNPALLATLFISLPIISGEFCFIKISMKIVSTGKTISTTEYLSKKLKARRRRRVIATLVLAILLVLIVFLSRQANLRISEVTVAGAEATSAEEIITLATSELKGYYLWLVPKDNAFIYPRAYVRSVLSRTFPRLNSVNLSLSGFTVLNIDVVEREPFALYCEEVLVSAEEAPGCYFLDKTGFIFDLAPSFSTGVYFIYAQETPLESPLGVQLVPQAEFGMLGEFISATGKLLGQPQGVRISTSEFWLFLPHGLSMIWKRGDDLNHLLSNLESFLASPAIKAQSDFLTRVKELDLRTEDKVFYSFR